MPTVTLNKDVFEQLVGKKLQLEELKDRISMLGTDLESIEGNEIHVEIFPNRPDMLSEQGFARAFSSFIGVKTGLREYNFKKSGYKLFVSKDLPEQWPYALSFIVKNIKLDKEKVRELIQLQEKIGVTLLRNRKKGGIGLYPLQGLEFPIRFEARKPEDIKFRPLEHEGVLAAKEILEKHKKGKEYGHLVQGWQKYTIFVDNKGTIMSMPPIINSHDVGRIDETTTDLFVECTGNNLRTISVALNIFAATISEMGGDVQTMEITLQGKTFDFPTMQPQEMPLDVTYINKRLGLNLSEQEAQVLLEKMGLGYTQGKVLIPAYRNDILHQVDLMEDIAIAYGYENFTEEIPNVSTIGEEDPLEKFSHKARDVLVGLQLLEAKNHHLMTDADLNYKMNLEQEIIGLQNALGEHNHLRNSLLPSLLKNLSENQHHEFPQNLFEIGRIFERGGSNAGETGITEKNQLAITLCHEKTDFTELKQVLEALLHCLGQGITVKEIDHPSFIRGRVAAVMSYDKEIGIIGEIHPDVLDRWGVVVPVVGLEISLDALFSRAG